MIVTRRDDMRVALFVNHLTGYIQFLFNNFDKNVTGKTFNFVDYGMSSHLSQFDFSEFEHKSGVHMLVSTGAFKCGVIIFPRLYLEGSESDDVLRFSSCGYNNRMIMLSNPMYELSFDQNVQSEWKKAAFSGHSYLYVKDGNKSKYALVPIMKPYVEHRFSFDGKKVLRFNFHGKYPVVTVNAEHRVGHYPLTESNLQRLTVGYHDLIYHRFDNAIKEILSVSLTNKLNINEIKIIKLILECELNIPKATSIKLAAYLIAYKSYYMYHDFDIFSSNNLTWEGMYKIYEEYIINSGSLSHIYLILTGGSRSDTLSKKTQHSLDSGIMLTCIQEIHFIYTGRKYLKAIYHTRAKLLLDYIGIDTTEYKNSLYTPSNIDVIVEQKAYVVPVLFLKDIKHKNSLSYCRNELNQYGPIYNRNYIIRSLLTGFIGNLSLFIDDNLCGIIELLFKYIIENDKDMLKVLWLEVFLPYYKVESKFSLEPKHSSVILFYILLDGIKLHLDMKYDEQIYQDQVSNAINVFFSSKSTDIEGADIVTSKEGQETTTRRLTINNNITKPYYKYNKTTRRLTINGDHGDDTVVVGENDDGDDTAIVGENDGDDTSNAEDDNNDDDEPPPTQPIDAADEASGDDHNDDTDDELSPMAATTATKTDTKTDTPSETMTATPTGGDANIEYSLNDGIYIKYPYFKDRVESVYSITGGVKAEVDGTHVNLVRLAESVSDDLEEVIDEEEDKLLPVINDQMESDFLLKEVEHYFNKVMSRCKPKLLNEIKSSSLSKEEEEHQFEEILARVIEMALKNSEQLLTRSQLSVASIALKAGDKHINKDIKKALTDILNYNYSGHTKDGDKSVSKDSGSKEDSVSEERDG
eukprot:GHVR01117450.1.p1 GENE.GHVR01117450.1~~GHVR01117450.1.p1  ORF type:complete len:864 (+),score=209.07 GHVR01117450.1:1736-4327(+)